MPPLPAAEIEPVPKSAADAPLGEENVYFDADPLKSGREWIAPWTPGEAPVMLALVDPDIKQSAIAREKNDDTAEGRKHRQQGRCHRRRSTSALAGRTAQA